MPAMKKKKGSKGSSSSSPGKGSVRWEDAPTSLTRRCVCMSIFGDTGSGKSTLAFTAPGPIAYLHSAEKIEGIIQPAAREKDIRVHNFGCKLPKDQNKAAKIASQAMADFKVTLEDAYTWARTIIIDTHTDLWELLRYARFGTLAPRGHIASMYAPVNAEWAGILKSFKHQDNANLILIGMTTESYRNDKPTGKMKMAGQKNVPYYSDVIIETERNVLSKGPDFTGTVRKGWWNAMMEGMEFEDEELEFSYLMSLITESDQEDWE